MDVLEKNEAGAITIDILERFVTVPAPGTGVILKLSVDSHDGKKEVKQLLMPKRQCEELASALWKMAYHIKDDAEFPPSLQDASATTR